MDKKREKNMKLYFILTILASTWVSSYGQKIQLLPYRQEDSETNCTHGLVSDVDTLVFTSEIDCSEDINFRNIYFQRKCKNDLEFLLLKLVVKNSVVIEQSSWKIIRPNVAHVTIKDKAKTRCSGARLRGVLITSDYKEIISDEQMYPEIREANDLETKLLINGVETTLQNNSCDIRAKGTDTVIIFECGSQVLPCLIEMSASDLMTPLVGKGYVLHISKMKQINITLKYATCTLHGKFDTFNCSIMQEPEMTTDLCYTYKTTYTLFTFIVISLIVHIASLMIILRRNKESGFSKVLRGIICFDGVGPCKFRFNEEHDNTMKRGYDQIMVPRGTDGMKTTSSILKEDEKQDFCVGNSLLFQLKNEDFTGAKNSINNGADVNQAENNITALMVACKKRHDNICLKLIEKGARVNEQSTARVTALMIACKNGSENIVRMLIENDADLEMKNVLGLTALMIACKQGHYNIVELLIECGADINSTAENKKTALMFACEKRHDNICLKLIEKGARVNERSTARLTALMITCKNGSENIVRMLIENDADLEMKNFSGQTALTIACKQGNYNIAELLIENGADVNSTDVLDSTPLIAACEYGHYDLAVLLINNRSRIKSKRNDGKTALMITEERGNENICKLLREKM